MIDKDSYLISIVVPLYNGERYIKNLINQFDKQTYNTLEVIFVDDGSKDSTYEKLLKTINDSNRNFYKVVTQENSGQGAARNRGIKEATGDYIMFVDQDDIIEQDYVEQMVNALISDNIDIVLSGYRHILPDGKIQRSVKLTNSEWCKYMNITPWGKLYKREFINKHNIEFLPVVLGEDIFFNSYCYSNNPCVVYTEYIGYSWVLNTTSVSNTIHKKVCDDTDVTTLFEKLFSIPKIKAMSSDRMFGYFLLKTGIFHLLYVSPVTEKKELAAYDKKVFEWLDNNVPYYDKHISLIWPKGEKTSIRLVVFVYSIFHRFGIERVLLHLSKYIQK